MRELRAKDFKSLHRDIDELYSNRWIDHSTRAVFIELTVYNTYLHVFCAIKYAMSSVRRPAVRPYVCLFVRLSLSYSSVYYLAWSVDDERVPCKND